MDSLNQQQLAAELEFVDHALKALRTERGVHATTAVAAAGRMAGSFLLRSFCLPLEGIPPGQLVLFPRANEEGPELMAVLGSALARPGVDFDRTAAEASAVATAYIMRQCAEALDPSAAFGLAVTGLVEGSRTAPDPAML